MSKIWRLLAHWLPFVAVAALFLTEQYRLLANYAKFYTNVDQTLLWYAGTEMAHGRIHQPNFYGQQYNTVFESVPGAWLHSLSGISLRTLMPLSTMLLVICVWFGLAAIAYQRGRRVLALLALAIPVILKLQYLMLFNAPRGVMAGDLLAVVAVAGGLWLCKETALKLAWVIGTGGLAVLWDYPVMLIIAPVFVYIAYQDRVTLRQQWRRVVLYASAAAILPAGWLAAQRFWYAAHPYDLTAPSVTVAPHVQVLLHTLRHFDRYVDFFAPAIAPTAVVAVIGVCGIVGAVIISAARRRSYGLLAAAVSLLAALCLALSVSRAENYMQDLYLSAPRLLLTLPMALWTLALLWSLDKNTRHPSRQAKPATTAMWPQLAALWLVAGLAAISFGATQTDLHAKTAQAASADIHSYFVIETKPLLESCDRLHGIYQATGAQLLATENGSMAYGCAAIYGIHTLIPSYERRGWLIKEIYEKPIERLLITGSACPQTLPKGAVCTPQLETTLLIQTPPRPATQTLRELGIPVRYEKPENY